MELRKITFILVILIIAISIVGTIFVYLGIHESISGKASSNGNVELYVLPTCGAFGCETPYEDCDSCSADCGICVCGDGSCNGNETCETCSVDCGDCPSVRFISGGEGSKKTYDFIFAPSLVQDDLYVGDTLVRVFNIVNTGNQDLDLNLGVLGLENFVFLNKDKVYLVKSSSEAVNLRFYSSSEPEPGLYLGKVLASSSNINKILPIIFTLKDKQALISLDVLVDDSSKIVDIGGVINYEFEANSSFSDITETNMFRSIATLDGDFLISDSESIEIVPGTNSFKFNYEIPDFLEDGRYLLYVNLTYPGGSIEEADYFEIKSPEKPSGFLDYEFLNYIILILIILLLFIIFLKVKPKPKRKKKLK